jgi:hypothetical protein
MAQGEGVSTLLSAGCLGTGFNFITGPARLQVGAGDADDARANAMKRGSA